MSTATLGRRLPSLSQPAPVNDGEPTFVSTNPCKVLTATSRYRNDPYRGSVLGQLGPLGSSDDGTDSKPIPTPPSELVERQTAAPRRPHSLRSMPLPTLHVAQPPATPIRPAVVPKPRSQASQVEPQKSGQEVRSAHPGRPATVVETSPDASTERGRGASKIALIQFKRTMMSAIYDSTEFPDISVGETVVVEGDRGEHIATVARVAVRKSKSTPTMILRYATPADLQQISLVREDEAIALEACRAHATRLGLDSVMSIVDVEFQLDFQKLTVFFEARNPSSFVDFRGLQRALYQHFRCRIWIVDC